MSITSDAIKIPAAVRDFKAKYGLPLTLKLLGDVLKNLPKAD